MDAWACSTREACPLCGAGEAGFEHLLQWCPVVGHAWEAVSGSPDIMAAVKDPGDRAATLARFLHQ
eukprot:11173423-Lingulodinium_polyedra.AAC.1